MDELDEQGIYRDKRGGSHGSTDQGILVEDPLDDDGIWREDPDPLDHYSYRTVHTDSGLGADKKSSSTTLNQVKSDFGSDEDYNQGLAAHRERDEYLHNNIPDNASQVDSKSSQSYRISELEASESVQGDEVSLENILDSEHDLEFPELNDDSYLFSDQSNQPLRSASQSGASDKSADLDKYISNLKYADNSALKPPKDGVSRQQRPFALDPAIVGYGDSYGEGGDGLMSNFANDNLIGGGGGHYGNQFDEEDKENRKRFSTDDEDVSDIGESFDANVKETVVMAKSTRSGTYTKKKSSKRDRRFANQRPPITGDSIFTQEEMSMPKHSLHEFEKLEAALDETESENEGDQMDLIGAYLKGLKDRDDEDDHVNDQEVASHQPPTPDNTGLHSNSNNKHRHSPSKIPVRSPTRSLTRSPLKSPMRQNGGGRASRSGGSSMAKSPARSPSKSPSRSTGIPSPTHMYSNRKSPSRHLRTSPVRSNTRSPRSPYQTGNTNRVSPATHLRGLDHRRAFSPGSPRIFDTEKNGYRRTRDTISMISGSVDEIMLEPSNSDNEEEDEEGDSGQHTRDSLDPPREGEPEDGHDDTAYSYGESIPFDSMIINQYFPMVDDPYSSLHAYQFKDDDEERPLSRAESPKRITKIPMLRSRSPSMSRPGSSLGIRSRPSSRGPQSRPESPARRPLGPNETGIPQPNINNSMKGSRRSLPLTPKKRKNVEEPQSLDTSIETSLKTPRSIVNGDLSIPYSARSDTGGVLEMGYQLSQAESELGRATNLLMMDDEDMKKKSTTTAANLMQDIVEEEKDDVPSLLPSVKAGGGGNSSKKGGGKGVGSGGIVAKGHRKEVMLSSSPPQVKMGSSPEPASKLSQEEYSGGEDLSQGSVASKGELKHRYVQEVKTRKHNEETVKQLSMEYSNLLKKYAEAENTIDELRLGAKVTLYSNSPTPSNAQAGTTHVMHHPTGFAVPTPTGHSGQEGSSQGMPSKAELGVMHYPGHRRPSQTSQGSSVAAGTDNLSLQPQAPSLHPSLSHDELESLAGEGVKLSLLTKAKGIEEQVNAFKILLEENHLTLEDQQKAMENIKGNYDNLQKDYHTLKEEHEYMRRQGALTEAATETTGTGFDEDNEVAGDLYKLNMKMDELEHTVQENSKKIAASRKPFASKSGPVRADHTIFGLDKQGLSSVEKPGSSALEGQDPNQLPMNRLASTGSIAGTAGVDERLHHLSKRYNSLMDKYRQLKGLKASSSRNQEMEGVLERIREVYEETPDHRKPALPPELENQYDTTKGSFVKPENIPESPDSVSPRPVFGNRTKPPAGDIPSTDDHDSDYHGNRYHRHHRSSRSPPSYPAGPRRARYGSLDSNSTDYTDKTPALHPSRARVHEESESDLNSPRAGRSRSLSEGKVVENRETNRRLPKPGPGAGSRRKDTRLLRGDGGDSGYFGSEGSRKAAAAAAATSSGGKIGERSLSSSGHGSRGFPSRRGTSGTSAGSAMGTSMATSPFGSPRGIEEGESDGSSSGSASSVIERKMERRRAKQEDRDAIPLDGSTRAGGLKVNQSQGDGLRARSRSRSRGKQAGLTESDRSASLTSGELGSPRSEKLKSLSDEVERLKATLSTNPVQQQQQQQGQVAHQPQLLVQGQPQAFVSTATGVPPIIPQQPQVGIAPQTIGPTPVVNFADPAAVAVGTTATTMNGYPVYGNNILNHPQEPMHAAMVPPQAMVQHPGGYDYYNDYNNQYGEMPPDPRDYYDYDPEYEDYEDEDYETMGYGGGHRRRRSLDRGDRGYRGQHRSGSRDRYDRDRGEGEYDSRESPRDYNDYDSRDRDFSDVKAARYGSRGRKASLPDNYYADSYGEKYDGDSRSSRGPNHQGQGRHRPRSRNAFDELLDEYDPSGARSQERRRQSKSRERYYSDPESPGHSPSRYSEMRRYYVPKRGGNYRGARDQSGSRSPSGGGHFSRRERYSSPTRTRAGRPPLPRGGPNGLPPPYPTAQRVPSNGYPRQQPLVTATAAGVYNNHPGAYINPQVNNGLSNNNGQPAHGYTAVTNNPQHLAQTAGYQQQAAYTPGASTAVPVGTQQQMTSCPTCGGKSSHSHSNFVFNPQPVNSNATSSNQSGLVPVQLVPMNSSNQQNAGKVRYYVREYGGESNSDVNAKQMQKKSRRSVKTVILSDDSDEDGDMDVSLNQALKTAKKLKKMSVRMKQTLHDEINKSIQDGSFLMT